MFAYPDLIPNLIGGEERPAKSGGTIPKIDPDSEECLGNVVRSSAEDVQAAIETASKTQPAWAETPGVKRGAILFDVVSAMQESREELASCVAKEAGKSMKDARGEVDGAIACGRFFAAEGQRLYGRTLPTSAENRWTAVVREPVGIAGLIIAANTPIANVAWKVFPALVCGNACVLKAAEDTPATAWLFGKIAEKAGLPAGLLNIIQGLGAEAGQPLAEHPDIDVLSFTGSTAVGTLLYEIAAKTRKRVSLELGGKNPFVVFDDADAANTIKWAVPSAFSNAGQRCASGSRLLIQEGIYEVFRRAFLEATATLQLGTADSDDLGPVINSRQLDRMLKNITEAKKSGATVLAGGHRAKEKGFYLAPTVLENVDPQSEMSQCELFGPIVCLYKFKDFDDAATLANSTDFGLTAAVHTGSIHRAMEFAKRIKAGIVQINGPTFGSEAHMPFGGSGSSGNGSREPGTEALDIYSNLKNIAFNHLPGAV
jgi:acyl-CoA reductase-like NAD-dependent aldehyde dehydrogenase